MRERWTRNKKMYLCVCVLAVFVFMLNCLTPYIADDFQYMFNVKDGERITSFMQIFSSLGQNYLLYNGRLVPHFWAYLFLMGPKLIFNIVNTVMFLILIAVMYFSSQKSTRFSAIVWFLIPVFIWQYTPGFGQVFLWEDGCFNYLWAFSFSVIYLIPYINLLLGKENAMFKKVGWKIAFCVYTFLLGDYSENVSFSVIFISFVMLATVMWQNKNIKRYAYYIAPIVCGAAGYWVILLSPGERGHVAEKGFGEVIKSVIRIMEDFYGSQKTLIILWAILMVIVVFYKANRQRILLSLYLFFISVCSIALLGFGSYSEERTMAVGSVFLIWAIVVLLQLLRDNHLHEGSPRMECVALCIGMYFIAGSLLNIWNGIYDIYETNCRNSAREQYILEQVAAGVQELTVVQIEPATTYCGKYGVADIFTKEQNAQWLNKAIAKYYGLEMIWGE